MKFNLLMCSIAMLLMIQTAMVNAEQKTPNNVFVEVRALNSSLNTYLRLHTKSRRISLEEMDVANATSADVYALAAVLNEKMRILLLKNNITDFKQASIPNNEITPTDVFELIKAAQDNLTLLTGQSIKSNNKTVTNLPSGVLREVILANNRMDTLLLGEINPQYPLFVVDRIQHELQRLLKHKGLPLIEYKYHYEFSKITPTDVFDYAELFHSQLRLLGYTSLDYSHARKPYYTPKDKSTIQPYHVFTLSVVNLYQIYLIEHKLGLEPDYTYSPQWKVDAQPQSVFHGYSKANAMLSSLFLNWH